MHEYVAGDRMCALGGLGGRVKRKVWTSSAIDAKVGEWW